MSSVSFTGLATGLDTASIVAQLVEIRRRPIYRLESRREDFQNQLTALSALKDRLLALQQAAAALDTVGEFNALKATSTHEDILTATADSGAAAGRYEIIVQSLATGRKDVSQGYASPDEVIGQGTVWFTVGGATTPLSLAAGTTLGEFRDLVNSEIDGVSASLINDGSGGNSWYLVLRADEEGTASDYQVVTSGLSGGLAPVLTNTQAAADASLTVDGLAVTAGSNHAAGVISGLTLDLHAADPGTRVEIAVDVDGENSTAAVATLVEAYNELMSFLQESSAPEGDLHGHPAIRSVISRLQNIISTPLSGGADQVSMLWEVGITTGEDHQLVWNATKFQEILAEDWTGVRNLFVERAGSPGLGYLMNAAIDDMTDSVSGLFKISTDALNSKIRLTDRTIERYERGLESYRSNLEARFTAMERMVAQLQAQGNYLGSIRF